MVLSYGMPSSMYLRSDNKCRSILWRLVALAVQVVEVRLSSKGHNDRTTAFVELVMNDRLGKGFTME